jgi:hypothetical protein
MTEMFNVLASLLCEPIVRLAAAFCTTWVDIGDTVPPVHMTRALIEW